jgi:anti-sigma B factor antagonist
LSNQPAERDHPRPAQARETRRAFRVTLPAPVEHIRSTAKAGGAQLVHTVEQTDQSDTRTVYTHDLTVTLEHLDSGVVVARVAGEVDLRSADTLRRSLNTAVRDARGLVLDFTGVTFLATAGLTCLIELSEAASRSKLPWALATTSRPVLRALEAIGYPNRIPVHPTRDAATAVVLAA